MTAGSPEPGEELECSFFAGNAGERDALISCVYYFFDGTVERIPIGDRFRVYASLIEDIGVVIQAQCVSAVRNPILYAVDDGGTFDILVESSNVASRCLDIRNKSCVDSGRHLWVIDQGDLGCVAGLDSCCEIV